MNHPEARSPLLILQLELESLGQITQATTFILQEVSKNSRIIIKWPLEPSLEYLSKSRYQNQVALSVAVHQQVGYI